MSYRIFACPVCSADVEKYQQVGDRLDVNCPRCGEFQISGTALAMLSTRLKENKQSSPRLSHAIRSRASARHPLFVASTNIDELLKQRLPGIERQLNSLLVWLAAELGDDEWGHTPMPWPEMLAGLIGAVDGDGVLRLIDHAAKRGLIEHDLDGDLLGLSPKGWKMIESLSQSEKSNTQEAASVSGEATIKANCNICHGERKAYLRATHSSKDGSGGINWSDTFDIVECCGCGSLSVRRIEWISEIDYIDYDLLTGKDYLIRGERVSYWPAPTIRKKPEWADRLDDDVLRNVLDEVYQALNHGMIVLASVGARTLLDRAMFLCVGDPKGGFTGKLKLLVERGHIGDGEREALETITDAGSAAAHRGFAPTAPVLQTIIEAIENFLQRKFVLQAAATEVKAATSQRRASPRDGGKEQLAPK